MSNREAPDHPGEPPSGTPRANHLAFVAHEIRNPLSTALWTAELLARLTEAERGGARGEKLAGICLRSIGRIRLLIEDHFLSERLEAGGYPLRLEPLALAEVLEEALGRHPADPVPVERGLEAGLLVRADRAILARLLEALVAAAAVGVAAVRVEGAQAGGRVEVRVRGGPPASLEDPGRGALSDPRGRALGLGMARRAAAALGGSLTVVEGAYLLSIPPA
jgi:signal transduction histidine kinase